MDLAALCEGRLAGDALERLEAHVARCHACLDLVGGLRAELREISGAAPLTLVPAHVLQAAMDLRSRDAEHVHASGRPLWLTSARRGLAAAAMLAIVAGGYHVGRSLPAGDPTSPTKESDPSGLTFGMVDFTSSLDEDALQAQDDGFGLFAIGLKEDQS
jgi:hypothetical protein